jgi:hypothetical protein
MSGQAGIGAPFWLKKSFSNARAEGGDLAETHDRLRKHPHIHICSRHATHTLRVRVEIKLHACPRPPRTWIDVLPLSRAGRLFRAVEMKRVDGIGADRNGVKEASAA